MSQSEAWETQKARHLLKSSSFNQWNAVSQEAGICCSSICCSPTIAYELSLYVNLLLSYFPYPPCVEEIRYNIKTWALRQQLKREFLVIYNCWLDKPSKCTKMLNCFQTCSQISCQFIYYCLGRPSSLFTHIITYCFILSVRLAVRDAKQYFI